MFGTKRNLEPTVADDWVRRIEARLERIEAGLRGNEARPDMTSEVGEVLHRFYKSLDRLDLHVRQAAERDQESQAKIGPLVSEALAASMPSIEAALTGEGSVAAEQFAAIGARLDKIDEAAGQLLQRPVPDPKLGEEVAGVRRRLSEDLTRRTEALQRRIDHLGLASQSGSSGRNADQVTSARLDSIEARLGAVSGMLESLVPGLENGLRGVLAELLANQVREARSAAAETTLHGNLSN